MSGLKAKGALSMYTEVKRAVCSKLAVSVLIFIQSANQLFSSTSTA